MSHSPLSQFEVNPIIPINFMGYDISFTNSSLFMVIATALILVFLLASIMKQKAVPGRLQCAAEVLHEMVTVMISDNIGKEGLKYFSLIFSIFMFILFANLLGMIPYSFTVTSHIVVNFAIAGFLFLLITLIGFVRHGIGFLHLFLPEGTPWWLAPIIIIIEIFSYFARPFSLSIRLTANMIAGHILLKVFAGFVLMLGIALGWLPIPMIMFFIAFEIFIAFLQAYIFTVLTCVYLNDAINLH